MLGRDLIAELQKCQQIMKAIIWLGVRKKRNLQICMGFVYSASETL
jgi:hypothetical protein